jgi:hypothetical protein
MIPNMRRLTIVVLCILSFLVLPSVVHSEWETEVRIGYDSNVDRATDSSARESDSYALARLSFLKMPSGESRLNWAFDASLLGSGYARLKDLSYVQGGVSPALVYYLHRLWTVSVAPFFEGKAVRDSDQSAYAFGGRLSMREQLTPSVYLIQFYRYKNNKADRRTYSYSENTLGAGAGMNLSKGFFAELSYQYSKGDSFVAVGGASASPSGQDYGRGSGPGGGGDGRYSKAFDKTIRKEMVDRHTAGILLGADWKKSLSTTLGYNYIWLKGDSGSADCYTAELAIMYRF